MKSEITLKNNAVQHLEDVTRFEVIDQTGRAMVRKGYTVDVSLQDDGRTFKIFLKEIVDKPAE